MKKSLCLILVAILLCSVVMLVACNEEQSNVPQKEMHTIKIHIVGGSSSLSFEVEHGKVIGDFSQYTDHSNSIVIKYNLYTDITCTNKWDLYHDVVLSDVTLFAKRIG